MKKTTILLFLFLCYSCSPITSAIYGIKKCKYLSIDDIHNQSMRLNIPPNSVFYVDTSFLFFVKNTFEDSLQNRYLQPLQLLVYKNGVLKNHIANCDIKGFPNLKWEPILAVLNDTMNTVKFDIKIDDYAKIIKPVNSNNLITSNSDEYIMFVLWSAFMGRQNKNFIKDVLRLKERRKIKTILYVNCDNALAKLF